MSIKYIELLKSTFKELKLSKNKIRTMVKHKSIISSVFAFLTILLGTIGMCNELSFLAIIKAIIKSIQLFALNLDTKDDINILNIIAFFCALGTIFFVAILFFVKDLIDTIFIKNILDKECTIVFGLGEINRSFLNNIEKTSNLYRNILIIEQDQNNKYIEDYRQKGFSVLISNAYNISYDLKNMKYALIAFGEDMHNMDFAKNIIKNRDKNNELKLVIHIENKDLEILFHTQFISTINKKINIKTFSFYEEVAKNLFDKYFIDGDSLDYIKEDSYEEFQSIIVGDGKLVEKVIYQIALLSHFPNENKHIINLISKNADQLLIKIKKILNYKNEEINFPSLELKAINLDNDSLEFYENKIWINKNIVNVIIAFDNEKDNLNYTIDLYNKVYLRNVVDRSYMPKILFGIYNENTLINDINLNEHKFERFFTFGNINEILNFDELFEEEIDSISKLIHCGYGDEYNKNYLSLNKEKINNKWFDNTRFSDKLSNIAQTKHIDLKLKAMELKKIKSSKDKNILLSNNQKMIFDKLNNSMEEINLSENDLIEYSKELAKFYNNKDYEIKYFPKNFTNLFEKMIRMEHNRWNAYHYINGWEYDHGGKEKFNDDEKNVRKNKKMHDCLLPLKYFDKDSIRITIIYDIYSILYIPNYLAQVGYEIVSYE